MDHDQITLSTSTIWIAFLFVGGLGYLFWQYFLYFFQGGQQTIDSAIPNILFFTE
ncbi:MAG: hypothetical protein ACJAUO_000123 [Sediminicola sp.]